MINHIQVNEETIKEIDQRVNIVDIISRHVVLKRQGKELVGLCPFHDEKTPSFSVNESKQKYYCFGCNSGGGAIKFLMSIEKKTFTETVLGLAEEYNIPVNTPDSRKTHKRNNLNQKLYEVMAIAQQYYENTLRQPIGQEALIYLQQERKISKDTIKEFGIGYAPPGWNNLYKYLVEVKHFPVDIIKQCGLIKPNKDGYGYYDVFRNRIIIPINDAQGRVIAFGGRTLTDEKPKYINSPDTELFNKGRTLFGLDKSKDSIKKLDQVIVVEGYFDAIAIYASGIKNVVASMGTALGIEQINLMLRYTDSNQIILNFDGDNAGVSASEKAISEISDLAYKGQVMLKIVNIPSGKDADEYLKNHSSEEYTQLLYNASPWIEWQINKVFHEQNLDDISVYQSVITKIINILKKIERKDVRDFYIQYCAELLSVQDPHLISIKAQMLINEVKNTSMKSNKHPAIPPQNHQMSLLEHAELLLLQIYIHKPEQRDRIKKEINSRQLHFSFSHHRIVWQKILQLQKTENLGSVLEIKILQDDENLVDLNSLFYPEIKSMHDIENIESINACLACIEINARTKKCEYLTTLSTADGVSEEEFLRLTNKLMQERREINSLQAMRYGN